jgi:Uma2 family endonuclease
MATIPSTTTLIQSSLDIEYPDSDGQPLGETGIHVSVILTLLDVLRRYYAGQPRVAVLANMFLYYVEGDPSQNVAPDLFVTRGVPADPTRRTFKLWEESKGPDLVIEVTSKKTKKEDQKGKFALYRDVLKVREYFLFDPEQEYLEPSLQGYRLVGKRYKPIAMVAIRLPSEVLGLHLERDGMDLRLYNPRTGRWQPTSQEIEEALRESEAARSREEAGRREAEAEIERLRREVETLRKRKSKRS